MGLLRTLGHALYLTLKREAVSLAGPVLTPLLQRPLLAAIGPRPSRYLAGNLLSKRAVDGAIVGGMIPANAWAKYALRKGLPLQAGQKTLAIENDPHVVDDFDGVIEQGYGAGVKKLLASEICVIKIRGKTLEGKVNYHEHHAQRAGLHYDLAVEGLPPGTPKWELHIPRGPYKGRYAFHRTERGMMVIPMKDRGLVLPKPDMHLKPQEFLATVNQENRSAVGQALLDVIQRVERSKLGLVSGPRHPEAWLVEQKLDGSLANVSIDEHGRAYFRSHRATGETYHDLLPQLEHLSNRSRVLSCRLLFPGPDQSGTVLKGELVHPDGVPRVAGILNSLPERARAIQKLRGPVKFYAWDIAKLRGQDVSRLPYAERRAIYEQVVRDVRRFNPNWNVVKLADPMMDPRRFYEEIVSQGLPYGEGVVVKEGHPQPGKGQGQEERWFKIKQRELQDYEIVDILEGDGKYQDSCGRLVVRNLDNQAVGEVGSFRIPDVQRRWIWDHRRQLVPDGRRAGAIVKVDTQGETARGVPRAGVFVSFHEGKGDTEAGLLMYSESLAGGDPEEAARTKYKLIAAARGARA